jgi:twinkle protein
MSLDANALNRNLLDRCEEVCLHLLPNGKRRGAHWLVGDIFGSAGESLQITMTGSAAGRFIDFSNKDVKGATMLWLWSKVKGISYKEALNQAAEFLGVKADDYGIRRHKPKLYAKPPAEPIKLPEQQSPVMKYLVEERKIDPAIIIKAKVGESEGSRGIVFPYADYDDEKKMWVLAHKKTINLERPNGKKDCFSTKGTKRCLYGKNLIDDNTSEIVICEGEIDCLSWQTLGVSAVSMPNGVSDMEWVDIDWEWLARFEKIYVSTDMDEPGLKAAPDICKRLGLHRCFIVSLPKKDANECLTSGVSKEDMLKALQTAKAIELEEIKSADSFKKDVVDHYETDPTVLGYYTPWDSDLPWRVRPGEMTVLSGFSGHGKSQALNQLMVSLITQGARIMDASLEVRPALTLYYMTRCALAKKRPAKQEVEACVDWLNDGLHFLDCIGTVNVDRLMAALEYSRKRYGTDVFIIDSLFKCGLSGEDFSGAREFADRLTTFCNNTGAHVILVAHSRKTQNGNEYNVPTKSDVAGSSDITNAAFNVLIVWRNKMKKRKMDEAKQSNNVEMMAEWTAQPDGKILLDKQRYGDGEECEINTWFNKESCQFSLGSEKSMAYFQVQ